jgi:hypothetical protein
MAAIGVACAVSTAPASAGKLGDHVAAIAAPGSKLAPRGGYYLLELRPGASETQYLRVKNTNRYPIRAVIEAVDAYTSDVTGVALATPGSPKARISRWIVVSSPEVTLAPDEERDVAFRVQVPPGTPPGQYLAAVSASVPVDADAPEDQNLRANQAAFDMSVQLQRAVAVEIDVAGEWAPSLVVTGAEPKATPNGIGLGVHIANEGNAFARGNGVIRVASTKTDVSFRIDTFVPGTAIVFPVTWTPEVVPGVHRVEVTLNYDGARRTSWSGTLNIAGDLRRQLEDSLRNVKPRDAGGVDPLLLVAGVLVAGFVAGAVVLRRRSRPRLVKYRPV